MICLPAMVMVLSRTSWLIDYLIFVWALNRGLRRIVDWSNGQFNSLSPISLTPILVSGLAAAVVIDAFFRGDDRIGPATRKALLSYGVAIGFSLVVGIVINRMAAVHAFIDYLGPVSMLGYAAIFSNDKGVIDRWATSLSVATVVVAAYGIYQYYTIPPWDAFWVRAVGFEGYLGSLKPTKMTLFSTLNERGPAATFLSAGLIVMFLKPTALGSARYPLAVVVAVAILLTYVRSAVILVAMTVILLPIVNRGAGLGKILIITLVLGLFGQGLLKMMPSSKAVSVRLESLKNVQTDGSAVGRVALVKIAFQKALTQPTGFGLGSGGQGGRLGGSGANIGDATGYMEIVLTFGWVGAGLIFWMLWQVWRSTRPEIHGYEPDDNVALLRAWFLAGMVYLIAGNWLAGNSFFWVLAGYCLGRVDLDYSASYANEDDHDDDCNLDEHEVEGAYATATPFTTRRVMFPVKQVV
jgi:putative inorganic carbon (HCO3(-)) transporter